MSTQKYYGLMTDYGLSRLRAATQGLNALTLSHMAFGDGNGQEIAPIGTMTALVNERYRAPIADKRPHETNPSILYVEAIIPPGIGGWTFREAGIYDSEGGLVAVAKTPVMDVALLAEGATTEGLVRLPIVFESAQDVQFFIDPTVLLATQSWVIDRIIHRPFITVESVTTKAPPASPADFVLYVVPTGATGAWAGKDGQMAHWHGKWQFAQAPVAKVVGASDTGKYWRRTATGWVEFVGDETTPGFMQFATEAEHKAGTRKDRATHPAGVAAQVQSGAWNYAVAGGSPNDLTAALNPALTEYKAGTVIRVKITTPNTGPATINVNGLGAVPIIRLDGGTMERGDMPVDAVVELVCTGAAWQLTGVAYSEVYRPAIGKITVWVRTDGNDANDGSANSAAKAKKTIRAAFTDTLRNVILNGQELEIRLGIAGTYAGAGVSGPGVSITIIGDIGAPSSYIITDAPGAQYCIRVADSASLTVRGCRLSSTYAGASLVVWALRGGRVRLETCDLVRLVSSTGSNLIYIASLGAVSTGGTIRIVGAEGAGTALEAAIKTEIGGIFEGASSEVPTNWQPYNLNCLSGFALAAANSSQNWQASTFSPVGAGNFGKRYAAISCGVIDTAGAGANFFPGATAGSTSTGGQYV